MFSEREEYQTIRLWDTIAAKYVSVITSITPLILTPVRTDCVLHSS